MTHIPNNDLANLLAILKHSAMRALGRCRDRYQSSVTSHHETVHEVIAFTVGSVLHLRESERDQREFLTDEYWDGKPHAPKEKNLSRLVTMFVLGAKESRGALYDQALIYTKVVDHFLGIDINPADIPAALKRKPIYLLLDEINPPKAKADDDEPETGGGAPAAPKTNAGRDVVGSPDLGSRDLFDEGNDDDGEDGDEGKRPEPARSGMGNGPKRKSWRDHFNPDDDLVIEGGIFFNFVWNLEENETVWVKVRAIPPIEDWKQFMIVDVQRPVGR